MMDLSLNFNGKTIEKTSSICFPAPPMNLPFSFIKKSPSISFETGEGTDVTHSSIMTESLNQVPYTKSIEVLDLANFKTQPCSSKTQHNYKTCFFYHNTKDRRRVGTFFSSDLCEFAEKTNELCPLGDFCTKSHNRLEQLYHADKYKTKFCSHFPKNMQNCEYGIYCSFAHAENEILIDLIHNYDYDEDFFLFHYKTVWCPFNLTQHDKGLCVYAHNWQDFRRKPHLYNYEPLSCPNWNHNQIVVNYEDGCPNNFNCLKCHGWKENEFHPLNYRTKPCPNMNNCSRGFACPFFHNIKDKRVISFNVLTLYFKFFPRNRIISNTFKFRRSSTNITKSSISSGLASLNPVMEENEKESGRNKSIANDYQGFPELPDNFIQEQKVWELNPCFSTPSKKKIMLPEINRKFSDSVPLSEKCYDKQFFMSQDNQDFGKNDENKDYLPYHLFGKSFLDNLEVTKTKYQQSPKDNKSIEKSNKSKSNEDSVSKDDDFSDLVDEINKLTQ